MTREEAKREILFAKREVMADSWIDKAYDVAIKALEQPERKKGKWMSFCRGKVCNCSVCYKGYDHTYEFIEEWNYCPNCGAEMERL